MVTALDQHVGQLTALGWCRDTREAAMGLRLAGALTAFAGADGATAAVVASADFESNEPDVCANATTRRKTDKKAIRNEYILN
jgi:hypothetical protein